MKMIHDADVTIDRPVQPLLSSPILINKTYRIVTTCFLIIGATLGACTSTTSQGPVGPLTFGQTAKSNYSRGTLELDDKNIDRARRYFKHVRREYPYSRYATLAELRLADCEFSEEAFAEAAASYRRFVRLHPTHENADHAAFRRGLSFHKMIPTDWFLVPPSHERDMSATRDALRELRSFRRHFEESDYSSDATDLVRDCLTRLAQHEMYVARFYLRRGKHKAAIGRTEVVEREYADSDLVAEAIFVRGETYMDMDEQNSARETFLKLARTFPKAAEAERARDYLRHLGVDLNKALAAQQESTSDDQGDEEP